MSDASETEASACQTLPESDLPMGPGAYDLTGRKFGRLEAIRVVEKLINGNRWLLRCECGRFAIRLAGYLVRQGRSAACSLCHRRPFGSSHAPGFAWARVFEQFGGLYSEEGDERATQLNIDDCERELGVRPDEPSPATPLAPIWRQASPEEEWCHELTTVELDDLDRLARERFFALEFSHALEARRLREHAERLARARSAAGLPELAGTAE